MSKGLWNRPLVDSRGFANKQFQLVINSLLNLIPFTGDGTPEGVVEAPIYSKYLDTTNQVLYYKFESEIGGDRSKGWIQI